MGIFKDPSIILLTQAVHAHHSGGAYESALASNRKVDRVLARAEGKGCCQVIRDTLLPSQSLHEILLKHMSSHVSVIHISGTTNHLREDEIPIITNIISQYPRLRVVFLEGCGTFSFVKSLLLKDVPVVLASPFPEEDELVGTIPESFYDRLSHGDSLKESFVEVQEYFEGMNQYAATYDIEGDRLEWEGIVEGELNELPHGLFLLHDHRNQLNWRLPHSERLVQADVEEYIAEPEPRKRKLLTISAAVLVGLGLLTTGFFLRSTWNYSSYAQENCHFSRDSMGMATVFLPFYDLEDGRRIRKGFSTRMKEKSQSLAKYPGLLTKYLPVAKKADVYKVIDKWVLDCHTDLLLWGEKEMRNDSSFTLRVNYVMPGIARDSLVQGWSSLKLTAEESSPENTQILIQDLIYTTIAKGFYEFENFEEAVKLFKQVSFTSSELNAEISLKMAQAYAKLDELDTARQYYHHAIRIDPDNAAAYHGLGGILVREQEFEKALQSYWTAANLSPNFLEASYNMGLVHFRLDQFEEAREAMKHVLDLDPRNARAKGILSAIYAKEQNEDLLYYYLEEALKDGLNIENLTTYTEVGSYQAEKRFRNLVEKY